MRKLIEIAIASGRKLQHPCTGLIHLPFPNQEDEGNAAIPLLENFYFALALFRSRVAENIIEAKTILERLLYFQNTEGNFPAYPHDYPKCSDWYFGFSLLAPMHWILHDFHTVLGSELKSKLTESAEKLLAYGSRLETEKELPFVISLKLAAAQKAFGHSKAEEKLRMLAEQDKSYWYSPATIGTVLASLQTAYPSLKNTPWQPLWDFLCSTWHPATCTFSGPVYKECQQGFEPQATLYDLYMGSIFNNFSKRTLENDALNLSAALIHPFEDVQSTIFSESPLELLHMTERYAVSHHELTPLRLIWGSSEKVHSFVGQSGNMRNVQYSHEGNKIILIGELHEAVELEDKEKAREMVFCLNSDPMHKFNVNGISATTFKMNDQVEVANPSLNFSMRFNVEEGSGDFIGHIMKGNRSSQVSLKGKNKYNAYDWQIFLRTLRRSEKCKVRFELTIQDH